MRSSVVLLSSLWIGAVASAGCRSVGPREQQGAVIGAIGGAITGAAIGKHNRETAAGAVIGAATGAVAGSLIGRYLDEQAREFDAIPDATVQRRDDSLLVAFSSEVLFDVGLSQMQPGAYERLRSVARTLQSYPQSQVIIKGHTDSTGTASFNQRLSDQRAERVAAYLVSEGVPARRIRSIGFGASMPVASNATQAGRQQNRRVELEIRPDRDVFESGGE